MSGKLREERKHLICSYRAQITKFGQVIKNLDDSTIILADPITAFRWPWATPGTILRDKEDCEIPKLKHAGGTIASSLRARTEQRASEGSSRDPTFGRHGGGDFHNFAGTRSKSRLAVAHWSSSNNETNSYFQGHPADQGRRAR